MNAIAIMYGEHVLDDLQFCSKHEDVIERYSHGLMTLQGSPLETLKAIALDPATVPGWVDSLKSRPQDRAVIRDFLERLIRQRVKV